MKHLTIILTAAITLCVILILSSNPSYSAKPGEISKHHGKIKSDCLKCHSYFRGIRQEKCLDCHEIHRIGFDDQRSILPFHKYLINKDCKSCHTEHNGIDESLTISESFEHIFITQPAKNKCSYCHPRPNQEKHKSYKDECVKCHSTSNWQFDHEYVTISNYNNCGSCHIKPNTKAHSAFDQDCSKCHTANNWKFQHSELNTEMINQCSVCHQRPNNSLHSFSTAECGSCHSTTKWQGATFDHQEYFVFDQNHPALCSNCHTSSEIYKIWNCYGCHEHTKDRIRNKHIEEGISNYDNCIKCHRTGSEHGGERRNERETEHGENHEEGDED